MLVSHPWTTLNYLKYLDNNVKMQHDKLQDIALYSSIPGGFYAVQEADCNASVA